MSFWSDLVDAAVLGAGRSTLPVPEDGIGALTASDQPTDVALLHLASLASRARRAGLIPASAADTPAPVAATADDRPEVGVAARQRLAQLLSAGSTELVSEWLRLLAATGCRPPDALLPALLTTATDHRQVRAEIVPVLGPLAAWLATANPAWEWALAAAPPSAEQLTWTTASHRARCELLERLRRAEPAAGRELIEATWSGDSARDKTAFITRLSIGLEPADEPLLNQALADGRGEVRRAAAVLLAGLPGSAFARRAIARATKAMRLSAGPSGAELIVDPPSELTAEMTADGLDPNPPRGSGRQAWLLRQVVATAPAGWWPEYTDLTPGELLDLAAPTSWSDALAAGWTEAALRDASWPWIEALLDRPDPKSDPNGNALLEALTVTDRDSWLAAHPHSPLFTAAGLVPAPWSVALSDTARQRIVELVSAEASVSHNADQNQAQPPSHSRPAHPIHLPVIRGLLRVAATRLEPPAGPDLNPADLDPKLAASWAEMIETLGTRAAMRRELAPPTEGATDP